MSAVGPLESRPTEPPPSNLEDIGSIAWLVERLPEACLVELGGLIVLANARACSSFGASADELVGRSVGSFLDRPSRALYVDRRTELDRGHSREPISLRLELLDPSARPKLLEATMVRLESSSGRPLTLTSWQASASLDRRLTGLGGLGRLGNQAGLGGAHSLVTEPSASVTRVLAEGAPTSKSDPLGIEAILGSADDRPSGLLLLAGIVENSPASIFAKDVDGRYILGSGEFARFLGRTREEIIGKTEADLFPSALAQAFADTDRRILETGVSLELESTHHMPADDLTHTFVTIKFPLRDADGQVVAVCGISTDITARKQAEEALRLSEHRFRLVFDESPIGMTVVDLAGKAIQTNPAFQAMVGRRADELRVIEGLDLATHPEDRERDAALYREIVEGVRDHLHHQKRFVRPGGQVVLANLALTLVRDENGRPQYVLGLNEDVTERRRAEQGLRASEERYRALYEDTPSMYFTVSAGGIVLSVNHFGASELGYMADELLGQPVLRVFYQPDRAAAAEHVADCLAQPGVVFDWQLRKVRKDGTLLWVKETARAIRAEDGEMVVLIVCEDITRRKLAEQRETAQHALTRALAESASLEEAAPRVVRALGESLGWDVATLWIVDRETSRLRHVQSWQTPSFSLDAFIEQSRLMTFARGVGLPGLVWASGDSLWVTDVMAEPRFLRRSAAAATGLHTFLAVPIVLGDEVLGVVDFLGRDQRQPDEDMIRLATTIGSQIGQFIERSRAEGALRESEARYRALYERTPVMMHSVDAVGRITTVSDAWLETFGYLREEVVGRSILDFMTKSSREHVLNVDRPVLMERGWSRDEPYQFIKKNGEVVDVLLSGTSRRDEGGTIVEGFSVLIDVTERKRAEQALRQSEERFKVVFNEAGIGIALNDIEGNNIQTNRAVQQMVGRSGRELRTFADWDQLTHPEDRVRDRGLFRELMDGNRDHLRMEKRYLLGDGSVRWVDLVMTLVRDPEGHPQFVVAMHEDVTQRKVAEAQRTRLEAELRQAQKMEAIGRLAGGVAHDFNNLLTAVTGYSEFLLAGLENEDPLRRDAEEIRRAAERATSLTQQLLAFSRQQPLRTTTIDLNEIVSDMDNLLRRLIGEDIALVKVLEPGLASVVGDRGQLEQVIVNLAVNARDAMPEGGRLTIATANGQGDPMGTSGPAVFMSVSDTGSGIEETIRSRIFEPFFTTKEQGKGTGLGLSTVYGIVEQHGGRVNVMSSPGEGATFRIELPAAAPIDEGAEATMAPRPAKGSETILLVEDEELIRTLAGRVLRQAGYTVIEARSGDDALDLAASHGEDLAMILTDVVMPGISGFELGDRLRTSLPDVRIIYMSGYTDPSITRRSELSGETGFLDKPFTPALLLQTVRSVLDGPVEG